VKMSPPNRDNWTEKMSPLGEGVLAREEKSGKVDGIG
jgi:hypothetical protein